MSPRHLLLLALAGLALGAPAPPSPAQAKATASHSHNYCAPGNHGNHNPKICSHCDPEIGCTECTPKGQCISGKGTNSAFRILTNYGEDYNYCAGGHDCSDALHCSFDNSYGCGAYSDHYEWSGGCLCKPGFYSKPIADVVYYYDSHGFNTSSTYWGPCENSCEDDFGCPYCDFYGCLGCPTDTFPPSNPSHTCDSCSSDSDPHCNQCYTDGSREGECIDCSPGWTVDPDSHQCVHCWERWGQGCTQCNELGCTKCSSSYSLSHGQCYACSDGCKVCGQNNNCQPYCKECKHGWFLRQNGKCRRCSDKYGSNCHDCNRFKCLA